MPAFSFPFLPSSGPLSSPVSLAPRCSAQALERQKEYTDAIRIERDELREETVKLKDILKVLSQAAMCVYCGEVVKF